MYEFYALTFPERRPRSMLCSNINYGVPITAPLYKLVGPRTWFTLSHFVYHQLESFLAPPSPKPAVPSRFQVSVSLSSGFSTALAFFFTSPNRIESLPSFIRRTVSAFLPPLSYKSLSAFGTYLEAFIANSSIWCVQCLILPSFIAFVLKLRPSPCRLPAQFPPCRSTASGSASRRPRPDFPDSGWPLGANLASLPRLGGRVRVVRTDAEKEEAKGKRAMNKTFKENRTQWEPNLPKPWIEGCIPPFAMLLERMSCSKNGANKAFSLTENEFLTLLHESIPSSLKTYFALADAKPQQRRQLAAGALLEGGVDGGYLRVLRWENDEGGRKMANFLVHP
ncbi:hypothetical protein MVEN_01720900 [Mycena venus]|uniref:Uncharacterized protein n=1 Tax=Mycena venus TaxID=2733690 RepID=A0A8H6XPC5_9AGAR|nr:hypothetical protein MVEN_01720900 [Mycena venus]